MNNYILRANANSKYGWDFVEKHDDGTEIVTEIRSKTTDGYIRFPKNDYGQTMIALKKLEGREFYELEPYKGRHSGGNSNKGLKTDLLEALALCLDANERATFLELCEKAKSRFNIFKRRESLKKQIAQAEAALKELDK